MLSGTIFKNVQNFVEKFRKTSVKHWQTQRKTLGKTTPALSLRCKTHTFPLTLPSFYTIFPLGTLPYLTPRVFHISTAPTTTTTNNINRKD